MTWVYIGCILLYVCTCVFLMNKVGYFVYTGVFHVVVTYGRALSCLAGFHFDILWPVPSLCSCFVLITFMILVFSAAYRFSY
jgi:hypothetical protein